MNQQSKDPDKAYSLYVKEPLSLDEITIDRLADLCKILGVSGQEEVFSLAANLQEKEDEPLCKGLTLDAAVDLHYALEDECNLGTVVMEDCEACDGVGLILVGENSDMADCGVCDGRGVLYLEECVD